MKVKKTICIVLCCVLAASVCILPANASTIETESMDEAGVAFSLSPYATGSFSFSIPGKSQAQADSNFQLAAGETVSIEALYTPFNASVDFGLVDEDGVFHYLNTKNGKFSGTISIDNSGYYTLLIRNNSAGAIDVSGQVTY